VNARPGGPAWSDEASEAFLEAARRAEARVAETAAAIVALNTENDAFQARHEARLSQRFDQLRDRVLLSSTHTLEALDRALEVARAGGRADTLVADAMFVRNLLSRILQEEGAAAASAGPAAVAAVAPAAPASPDVRTEDTLEVYEVADKGGVDEAPTVSDAPAPASARGVASRGWMETQSDLPASVPPAAASSAVADDDAADATVVLEGPEAQLVRPAPRVPDTAARPAANRVTAPASAPVPRPPIAPPPAPRRDARPRPAAPTPAAEAAPIASHPAAPARPARAPGRHRPALGLVAVVVLAGILGAEVWRRRAPEPPVAPPPSTAPRGEATPLPIEEYTVVSPKPEEGEPPTSPDGPGEGPVAERTPPPPPSPSLSSSGDAPPEAGPSTAPPPPTPPPVSIRVANLLGEARTATASRDYDTAITKYDEALKLDPENVGARRGLLRARGERAAIGRFFQAQFTMCDTPKGETCDRRELDCKLVYTITPAKPVQGDPYTVEVGVFNIGEKALKIRSLSATLSVSGTKAPHPITTLVKEIPRGARNLLIARVQDVWPPGTTSWWMEVSLTNQKGDTYRAQYTWELPKAP
jgi:hypothetical protein